MDVVAIGGRGIYVTDGEHAWKVASDEQLRARDDDLAEMYQQAVDE